jgi:hypothetical protein
MSDLTKLEYSDTVERSIQKMNAAIELLNSINSGFSSMNTDYGTSKTNSVTGTPYNTVTERLNGDYQTLNGRISGVSEAQTTQAQDIQDLKSATGGTTITSKFSDLRTYAVGELAIYNGNLFKCTTAIETPGAFDATDWELTTIEAELASILNKIGTTDISSVGASVTAAIMALSSSINGTSINVTLNSSNWSSGSYTISDSNIKASSNGIIGLSVSASSEQRTAAREAIISVTNQASGKLILTADGDIPSVNIPVTIILL